MTPGERRLLLRAALLVGVTRAGLRLLPFATVLQLARKLAPPGSVPVPVDEPPPRAVAQAVCRAARLAPGDTRCLPRAIAAQQLLQGMRYPSQLRIGVDLAARPHLAAHAWVEADSDVVVGRCPDLQRFAPLPSMELR